MSIRENGPDKRYARIAQLTEWRRYDEALKETEALVREDPEDAHGYAVMAHLYLKKENYEKALYWCDEAMRREPEETLAWFVRVLVHYETQNRAKFKETIGEAMRIDPYEPHYYFLNANILNKEGKFQEALKEFEQALALNPESAITLAAYSYTLALVGQEVRAREAERKALEGNPESAHVYLYLSWTAEKRGDYETELAYLQNAVRLAPEDEQIRKEYLEGLQKQYAFYRVFLWPGMMLRKLKPWQILVIWMGAWFLFKPLLLVFIALHVLTHWFSRLLVHVKVFGWRRAK